MTNNNTTAFSTPEPITATVTTAGARVRVAASERADTVVRVEPIDGADKSDVKVAEHTKVDFSAGELSVKTTKPGDKDGSVAITVELPVGSRLVLSTAWTDVRADGPLGDCALNASSGRVQLDHVAGTADIECGAAEVRIGEVEGAVRYQGSTGKLWIGHARSDIDLRGAGGRFEIDRAEGGVVAEAGNCPIRVGRITRGRVELRNAAGGIEVGVSEGSAARVDAKSTKGAVRNSLPAQDNPDELDNQVTIFARTRLDDIVIHRAAH